MNRTQCKMTVTKCEYLGKRSRMSRVAGEVNEPEDCWNVALMPWYNPDPNHPNSRFFQSTPSGQLQLFQVMNFNPKVGSDVDVFLEFELQESIPEPVASA